MSECSHNHNINNHNEKKTLGVIIITVAAMLLEILYGYLTNSMALLADGYHMGCHALALFLTYIAYILIRKLKDSTKFPSGTDKIGTLAAYTSSLFLGFTGVWIIFEAVLRLVNPLKIQFSEAILVAIIGLVVNVICILVMNGADFCSHHKKENKEHLKDYNFKAAYCHILADAVTSVLALCALFIGKYCNIFCFDSIVGILGGMLILKWAVGLLKNTVKILIDMKA